MKKWKYAAISVALLKFCPTFLWFCVVLLFGRHAVPRNMNTVLTSRVFKYVLILKNKRIVKIRTIQYLAILSVFKKKINIVFCHCLAIGSRETNVLNGRFWKYDADAYYCYSAYCIVHCAYPVLVTPCVSHMSRTTHGPPLPRALFVSLSHCPLPPLFCLISIQDYQLE